MLLRFGKVGRSLILVRIHYVNLRNDECFRVLTEKSPEAKLHDVFIGTPSEAFAHSLLSTILCLSGRYVAAAKESEYAIRKNNFLWSSICKIVQFDDHSMADLFRETTDKLFPCSTPTSSQDDLIVEHAKSTVDQANEGDSPEPSHTTPTTNIPTPQSPVNAPRKSSRIHEACEIRKARLCNQNQDSENAGGRNRTIPIRLNKLRQVGSISWEEICRR